MEEPQVQQMNIAVYRRRETSKSGELTLVTQVDGQMPLQNQAGLGLYHQDTRFLSGWELWLNKTRPLNLFSSTRVGSVSRADLTNPGMRIAGRAIPMHTIHLRVTRVLEDGLHQRIRIVNFNLFPITLKLRMIFMSDFADVFEVRGARRAHRGRHLAPKIHRQSVTLRYTGRDKTQRHTQIYLRPAPQTIRRTTGHRICVTYQLQLPPKERRRYIYLRIQPFVGPPKRSTPPRFERVLARSHAHDRQWKRSDTQVTTDNDVYQHALWQAEDDLRVLTTTFADGTLPVAGLPWYDCPFGRDSLITAWQVLMLRPDLTVSTLRFLAKHQGRHENAWRDEEPGKILHELRAGDMARAGEIPHTPYYGTVDATLLFIMVLGRLDAWVHDIRLVREFEEPLRRALRWIECYGDADGDGFVEYQRLSSRGLANQCWKDSHDGIVDARGRDPKPPIALVEVQAYLFEAYMAASQLLQRLGDKSAAQLYQRRARDLRVKFIQKFWSNDRCELAFGLDGRKRPFYANVSNIGQVLASGLLSRTQARHVIRRLFEPDMYSGWGIRTRSKSESVYNPMSYHNGSVWPHDNAIIASGLRRYGALRELDQLVTGFFDAMVRLEYYRLPELFCGFVRRRGEAPVIYPSACTPQAWAAGSTFQFLQVMLGIRAEAGRLIVGTPILPHWLKTVRLKQLRIGRGAAELAFERKASGHARCRVIRTRRSAQVILRRA